MAEWLKAAVLKTVEGHTSGGSNPSLPATIILFCFNNVRCLLENPALWDFEN